MSISPRSRHVFRVIVWRPRLTSREVKTGSFIPSTDKDAENYLQSAMSLPKKLNIDPPLLNSACPWATTQENLKELLLCQYTGAVTTRTSLIDEAGFDHRPDVHQYLFFDPMTGQAHSKGAADGPVPSSEWANAGDENMVSSINSLGYSPISLTQYLDILKTLSTELPHVRKPVIISVTGSPEEVRRCHDKITGQMSYIHFPLAMEVNLSCPNIPGKPPPAYTEASLREYVDHLPGPESGDAPTRLPVGLKIPPFTYSDQLQAFLRGLAGLQNRISFFTAVNTLGFCQVGAIAGGMAGPALHPLALGNVTNLRKMLDTDDKLRHIDIIGVGGVMDTAGYIRMRTAGASAVAVATALGRYGIDVFERIHTDTK